VAGRRVNDVVERNQCDGTKVRRYHSQIGSQLSWLPSHPAEDWSRTVLKVSTGRTTNRCTSGPPLVFIQAGATSACRTIEMSRSRPGASFSPAPSTPTHELDNGALDIAERRFSNSRDDSEAQAAATAEFQDRSQESAKERATFRRETKEAGRDPRDEGGGAEDGGGDDDGDDDDDLTVVPAEDSVGMATWSGIPSVKGSSEAMRMVLLTFTAIGITYVFLSVRGYENFEMQRA
jgi:hypothetical protein